MKGSEFRNPVPTVDIVIQCGKGKIILIKRKNPPPGWALPGGFVDYGECMENAAIREAKEETSLEVKLTEQFFTYSKPDRDPRQHTIATVYIADILSGTSRASDDAVEIGCFSKDELPENIAFDHKKIIVEYFLYIENNRRKLLEE